MSSSVGVGDGGTCNHLSSHPYALGLADALGDTLSEALADGEPDALGETDSETEALGDTDGLAELEGDAELDGDTLGLAAVAVTACQRPSPSTIRKGEPRAMEPIP
jgi:hypothetical protein